jgi:hypothetical protein
MFEQDWCRSRPQKEKRNKLNRQRKLDRGRHTKVVFRGQLREISTVLEYYCGKEGQSDKFCKPSGYIAIDCPRRAISPCEAPPNFSNLP